MIEAQIITRYEIADASGIAELHLIESDVDLFPLAIGKSYNMSLLRAQGDRNIIEGFRFNVSWSTGFQQVLDIGTVKNDSKQRLYLGKLLRSRR